MVLIIIFYLEEYIMKNVYFKKCFVLIIFLLIMFCVYPCAIGFNQGLKSLVFDDGNTLYVGGVGPGNYTKIQDAIDDAIDGDTVFVFGYASPYHENVVIDKSIFLIGEDKNLVVIDADFKAAAVTITAYNVFVSGFTMIHPPAEDFNNFESELVDIVSSENVTIRDNIMQQNQIYLGGDRGGIIIRNSSYCFIQNNTIIKENDTRPSWGIVLMLGSFYNNISGNEINCFAGGVSIMQCSDNVIYMNYLYHNNFGILNVFGNNNMIINNILNFNHQGIRIEEGHNNLVFRNNVIDNGEGYWIDNGIVIAGGSDNYISYNHISNNNPNGIQIISINNNITDNYISNNNIGVSCEYGYNNYIARNNFIHNKKNGYILGVLIYRNIWDRNYWNRPRLLPYPIFGKGIFLPLVNFDWHPALKPYDI